MANKVIQLSDGTNDLFPTLANTTIESGTDLNDLMDEGLYNCPNSTIAGSLTNSPITNAGFPLLVFRVGTSVARIQVVYGGSTIYSRRRTSSAWGNWYAFAGTT